jgi:hypothetical protein
MGQAEWEAPEHLVTGENVHNKGLLSELKAQTLYQAALQCRCDPAPSIHLVFPAAVLSPKEAEPRRELCQQTEYSRPCQRQRGRSLSLSLSLSLSRSRTHRS